MEGGWRKDFETRWLEKLKTSSGIESTLEIEGETLPNVGLPNFAVGSPFGEMLTWVDLADAVLTPLPAGS